MTRASTCMSSRSILPLCTINIFLYEEWTLIYSGLFFVEECTLCSSVHSFFTRLPNSYLFCAVLSVPLRTLRRLIFCCCVKTESCCCCSSSVLPTRQLSIQLLLRECAAAWIRCCEAWARVCCSSCRRVHATAAAARAAGTHLLLLLLPWGLLRFLFILLSFRLPLLLFQWWCATAALHVLRLLSSPLLWKPRVV